MLDKFIRFLKQIKSNFMEGYNNGRMRSYMGWSYNLKQWRKKK